MCHLFTTLKTNFSCSGSNKHTFNLKPLLKNHFDLRTSGNKKALCCRGHEWFLWCSNPSWVQVFSEDNKHAPLVNCLGHGRDLGGEGSVWQALGRPDPQYSAVYSRHVKTSRYLKELCNEHETGIWVIKAQASSKHRIQAFKFSYSLIWTDRCHFTLVTVTSYAIFLTKIYTSFTINSFMLPMSCWHSAEMMVCLEKLKGERGFFCFEITFGL